MSFSRIDVKSSTNTEPIELLEKTFCREVSQGNLLKGLNLCCGKVTPMSGVCQGIEV